MTHELPPSVFWLLQVVTNLIMAYIFLLPGFPAWAAVLMFAYWWLIITDIGPKGKLRPVAWWIVKGWEDEKEG